MEALSPGALAPSVCQPSCIASCTALEPARPPGWSTGAAVVSALGSNRSRPEDATAAARDTLVAYRDTRTGMHRCRKGDTTHRWDRPTIQYELRRSIFTFARKLTEAGLVCSLCCRDTESKKTRNPKVIWKRQTVDESDHQFS